MKKFVLRGHSFTEANFEADVAKEETSSDLEKDYESPEGRVMTVDDERFHSTSVGRRHDDVDKLRRAVTRR